jgi:hypothetical protein
VTSNDKQKGFWRQLRKGFAESEWFQQPVKSSVTRIIEIFAFGIVCLAAAFIAFPFTLRSIIAESLVFIVAICLSLKLIKKTTLNGSTWRFWAVLGCLFICASLCPYSVAPKPVYMPALASYNPSKSQFRVLESGGKTIGSVLLVSDGDFIRPNIFSLLRTLSPDKFRVLEKTDHGNYSYYSLPNLTGFLFPLGKPGDIPPQNNVYFPSAFLSRGIGVNIDKPELLTSTTNEAPIHLQFQLGFLVGPLIDFAYTRYPDTIPWDAVQVGNGQDIPIAVYSAVLDRTLEFFASGATEQAINGLDSAFLIVPANNLEGARLGALKYAAAQLSLTGNVGELQSLPFLHNAYKIFLHSQKDPRFSDEDPVMNWVRGVLLDGYNRWGWSTKFFDRVSALNRVPHIPNDEATQKLYTEALEKTLKGKTYGELLTFLRSTNHSAAELHFIKYLILAKLVKEEVGRIGAEPSDAALSNVVRDVKNVTPLMRTIDASLMRQHELQSDPFSGRMSEALDVMQDVFAKAPTNAPDSEVARLALRRLTRYPVLAEFARLVAANDRTAWASAAQKAASFPWWKTEYLMWFVSWSAKVVQQIEQHDYPWAENSPPLFGGSDVRKESLKHGTDYFTKDLGGNGEAFLPGVFFLTWYAQTFHLDCYQELRQQFEEQAGMPFDTYRSKLFSP